MLEPNSGSVPKPQIHLSLSQAALVILCNSGVVYHNQTRGAACMQRYVEGVLVPLTDPDEVWISGMAAYHCPIESALCAMDWEAYGNLDTERADAIDAVLQGSGFTRGITVDRTRLNESEEAWVYVAVEDGDYFAYSGFGACCAVLVWSNSD